VVNLTDKLIQKYLSGKTSRDEERLLLDMCLKDINVILDKYNKYTRIKEVNKIQFKVRR